MHHAVDFDVHVAFDGVAGERTVLQFGDAEPAETPDLVMAAARERCRGETKGVDPARIGRDVAQLGAEHRDAGRDLVDEMPQPIRWEGTALAADACCHSCANIWARRILGFSDLKKHEVAPRRVLAQYSIAPRPALLGPSRQSCGNGSDRPRTSAIF